MADALRFARIPPEAVATTSLEQVQRYLPANYEAFVGETGAIIIQGHDNAGWTLDGYVIPRLASGLIFAREFDPFEGMPRGLEEGLRAHPDTWLDKVRKPDES